MVPSLVNANERLHADNSLGSTKAKRYRSLIDELQYLSHTCQNIMYVVGLVSRFISNPSKNHLAIAKKNPKIHC